MNSNKKITIQLSDQESMILISMVEQIAGILEGEAEAIAEDSFARWQNEFTGYTELDFSDPVIARLFPDAYPNDMSASDEFRRLALGRQRQERLENAQIILTALRGRRSKTLKIPASQLDAWLKTIVSVRLSLAIRLGIENEQDAEIVAHISPDDPRSFIYEVYEWLAYFCENLLAT